MFFKILTDNMLNSPFISEWGLSVYIEHNGHKILLDTGSSDAFARNAEQMNISLENIEYGVLSHAHYDHANGMPAFFSFNSKAKFYVCAGAGEDCFSRKNGIFGYIGIKKGTLDAFKDRIRYVDGIYKLYDGVWLVPHCGSSINENSITGGMFRYSKNKWVRDDFSHEQSLVIETDKGLVIFNSCSHGGADNIINEVSAVFPNIKPYAIIGGFHLYKSSEEEILSLCKKIDDTGIEKVITGHCTENAFEIIKKALNEKAYQIYPGFEMNI